MYFSNERKSHGRAIRHSQHIRDRSAFADAAKKRRWFAEDHNHDVEEFAMEFRIGGIQWTRYRLKEGTPFPGVALSSEGSY
jgi:hypothetical protein